jgi:hypothetical protein
MQDFFFGAHVYKNTEPFKFSYLRKTEIYPTCPFLGIVHKINDRPWIDVTWLYYWAGTTAAGDCAVRRFATDRLHQ